MNNQPSIDQAATPIYTRLHAWYDIQINGAFGLDFNSDHWDFEQADTVARRLADRGCAGFLATVITDAPDAMFTRVQRIAQWIAEGSTESQICRGIHVEGPFLSDKAGYVGAHPPNHVRDVDIEILERLHRAGDHQIRLWTIAPERDRHTIFGKFTRQNAIVYAGGHSDADATQLDDAIDQGMKLFTHLGNGCPNQLHRHDNIISRILARSDRICISWIADGHHVPRFALRNYWAAMPQNHIIVTSDAMAAAGLGPGIYQLGGQTVEVDHDLAAWAASRTHYAGSATLMDGMWDGLQRFGSPGDAMTASSPLWNLDALASAFLETPKRLIEGRG